MKVEKIETDHQIWRLFADTFKLISRSREMELAQYGLTPEQSYILHILIDSGGISTINEIANLSLRRHNSVSTIVKRMEDSGLIKRVKLKEAKHYQIEITEKGRDLFESSPAKSIEMAFSTLSQNEKQNMIKIFNKLSKRTRDLLGIDYKPLFLE